MLTDQELKNSVNQLKERHIISNLITGLVEVDNHLIEKRKEEAKKLKEEDKLRKEDLEEELKTVKQEAKINKFWNYEDLEDVCNLNRPDIYQEAYAIYEKPFKFLKELVQSLQSQLLSDSPNLPECRNLIQQINEFFK